MQAMLEAVEDGLADPAEYLPALNHQVQDALGARRRPLRTRPHRRRRASLEVHDADLGTVMGSCVRGFEAEARAKRVRLDAAEAPLPAVLCAPEKVERVLHNLLTNALRHTPSDGAIAVVASGNRGA